MKRIVITLGVAGIALATADARAADIDDLLTPHHRVFESPQNFAFEVRTGLYTPDIDSDPNLHGKTPYKDSFGTAPRVMPGFEFDWQAIRVPHFGSLGPAVGLSATQMSAKDQLASGTGTSAETSRLQILPMYAVAVLRVDVLWKDVGIPLVPYGKLGVSYALWRASNNVDGTATASEAGRNVLGEGHTWGTQLALGVAFNLNVLDPITAKNLDNSTGVNNSYIFAELVDFGLTGLGSKTALRLNDLTWTAGIAFEF